MSDAFTEVPEDGKPGTVQGFERARFEQHPEHAVAVGEAAGHGEACRLLHRPHRDRA